MQTWFLKIRPNTDTARVRPLIEKAAKEFEQLSGDDKSAFLKQQLDLDIITPSLTELGIDRITISQPPTNPRNIAIKNSVVVDLEHYCSQGNYASVASEF